MRENATGAGFIKLHRQILNWEWYDDINTKTLFIHLLLTVNYEPKRWHGITVPRGGIITSVAKLAAETGLSQMQIRRAINNLQSTNEITKRATNKYTLIIVENYSLYQDKPPKDNKQITNKQQADNKQTTTTKEYKESKEIKKRESTRARARDEKSKKSYGRFNNVLLTDDEYKELKETFNNLKGLINKASIYFGKYPDKAEQYGTHAALLWQIGTEDNWPRRKKTITKPLELSKAEKEKIRQAEQDYLNQI